MAKEETRIWLNCAYYGKCELKNGYDELQAELKLYRESRNYPEIIKLTKQRDALLTACKAIQRARDAYNTADVDFDGAELDKLLDDAITEAEK